MTSHEDNGAPLTDHDYDGIRELDNNLPEWWLALFGLTVAFSFIYWLHYSIAGGPSTSQELAASMARLEAERGSGPSWSDGQLAALFTADAEKQGREVFAGKCAVCHGPAGGGIIGPNLTDKFWLHGRGTPADLVTVIGKGVPDKGMPPWEGVLSKDDLVAVAAFIHSIEGTSVPGKPPQGTEVP